MSAAARRFSVVRRFLESEAAGGVVLMVAAGLALLIANTGMGPEYFHLLHLPMFGSTLLHWVNDGLMALFFLLVGLEIKREMLDGELSTWSRRALPGIAAVGGMAVPALIYVGLNWTSPETLRGWAIPAATDIAFALGVMALLGKRVPSSLKVFLAALAIIDDLGAVLIIALFYTSGLSLAWLAGAAAICVALFVLNRMRVMRLSPYLILGAALWVCVLKSGVHATLAGVALALFIPLKPAPAAPDNVHSPLHRLEYALAAWVAFLIVPVFGFANAGVSLADFNLTTMLEPVPLGVAAGLFLGKQFGVFAASWAAIKFKLAELPACAAWNQLYGVSVLCGIGFTMSLFIGLLAFDDPHHQSAVKLGVLVGSGLSGVIGWLILRLSSGRAPQA
ncbi:Na+/H+ antiporter NhaA [Caulobacter sp. 17J65-9]|uniref:Na+/H+ antiporter NhaA n=1 Tax=Caulobacter sp. 17J65-9 TaxID=2709382 RepID=UPI0013CCC259|nr:Na+/H+ antiporter NhaA [Caulobacter sp. 17J65-9]NEX95278.1 Na+/H+ antiporter NhaA [Caulobacter sp. 17J65-9]